MSAIPNLERDQSDPLVPIGAVVALLRPDFPDVSPSSLRFLERAGLLSAARTPGGHRLYTPADIERIRQIKTWQRQRLSLAEIAKRLAASEGLPAPAALADAFLQRALSGDLAGAYQAIVAADELGLPLETNFGDVLQPALTEVGRRWETGEIPVAQEKEISELARDLVADLARRHARPEPAGPSIVAACVEGERHELGLCMVCGLLRERGCAVHLLGADVAPRFVLEAVRLRRPAAVLLSARLALNVPAVKDAIDVLVAGLAPHPPPPIVVGGHAAAAHPESIRAWGATPIGPPLGAAIAAALAVVRDRSAADGA